MTAPERIWAFCPDIFDNMSVWQDQPSPAGDSIEYLRADLADAAIAAAYEAAANEARSYMEPHVANGIRALATDVHTNALEAVRREARAEAFNTALMEIEGHLPEFGAGDPQDGTDLIIDQTWRSFRKIVLALIDKETTE